MAPPPQHTCLGLLIVEARREAAGDAWKRISTCYGRTAAAQATPAGGGGASNAPTSTALDLAAHHLESRQDARADDMHLMTACLGRSVYEVTPVYEDAQEEAPQAAGGDGAGAASPRRPRRSYAPPPACAGIELLQVMRASAAAEAARPAQAPARRPWPTAAAAPSPAASASATASSSSSADELAAFGRRFASRAEKNAAAMYKLLSDIGTGLVRGRED